VLIALIPAHNEATSIATTLDAVLPQLSASDACIVVADNCTDATVEVSRERGATVWATSGNRAKKAGALNQALDFVLPQLADDDHVLVMDADTWLDSSFVECAVATLERGGYGGVGGTFRGGEGGGFVGMLQRNEYARYGRDVHRLKGKVLVLTGTAAIFSVRALRAVIAARLDGRLPGGAAQVYDTRVLTEDNELTLALMHLGYKILSPAGCTMVTEVMTSWRDLYAQRLRWKRGAIENLVDYGLTRITWRYWLRQLWTFLGVVVTGLYLGTLLADAVLAHGVHVHAVWAAVTVIFAAERVVTVRQRGWSHMAYSALLVIEMPYDIALQGVHLRALWHSVTHRERNW